MPAERAKAAAEALDTAVREALPEWLQPQDASEFLARVARSENDRGRPDLGSELGRFAGAVPAGGQLLPATVGGLLHLLDAVLGERRNVAWEAFHHEAADLVARLAGLLGDETESVEAAGETAGALAGRFLDPVALAAISGHRPTASSLKALSPDRRTRLAEARSILEALPPRPPTQAFFHTPASTRIADSAPTAWAASPSEDPCVEAAATFDREAAVLAKAVAARHRARLELAGDFDPERHDPGLDRLDWHAFSADERALLPPVVALLDAEAAAGPVLGSLSRLLRSGRPLQTVVLTAATTGTDPDAARFEPGLLGIAHRSAQVAQTAAARPSHALAAVRRAAETGRSALYVVEPTLEPAAAIAGRAHPLFLYDPEAEGGLERRIDLAPNPEPEADWPSTAAGVFTFADYALTDPALAGHFRIVSEGLRSDSAVVLFADWLHAHEAPSTTLQEGGQRLRESVPSIVASTIDGEPVRLAVDRTLARVAKDRLDVWRTLQGLAGLGAARTAAARAREEALLEATAERERQEARHAAALAAAEVRAAERLASRFTELLTAPEPGAGTLLPSPAPALALTSATPPPPDGRSVDRLAAALTAVVSSVSPAPPSSTVSDPRVEALTARLQTLVAPGA